MKHSTWKIGSIVFSIFLTSISQSMPVGWPMLLIMAVSLFLAVAPLVYTIRTWRRP